MKKVVLSICCLVLASCGSNRGNQTTPLTADQKSQFGETLTSVGRAHKAGLQARTAEHRAAPAISDETLKKMSEQLQAGKCEITVPKTQTPANPQDPSNQSSEFGMKISGATCPVAMDFSMKNSSKMTDKTFEANFEFAMAYSVTNADFAKLNDVTAIDIKGGGKVTAGNGSANGDLNVEGTIKSQQLGDLKMYVIGKVEGKGDQNNVTATATTTLGIEYPKYTAELKQVATIQNKTKTIEYFLNGQKITEQEFRDLVEKAGTIGAVKADVA